jgi:uncharacterized LabA/DUF88 family protein
MLDGEALEPAAPPEEPNGEEAAKEALTTKRRRRRRRGGGNGNGIRHLETIIPPEMDDAEPTPLSAHTGGHAVDVQPDEEPTVDEAGTVDLFGRPGPHGDSGQPYQIYGPYPTDPWSVSSAYQQISQPQSPFGAPAPSPARGLGAQPRGGGGPTPERFGRGLRGERATETPSTSANQLGAMVTQALQQQTDRLLGELRHTQTPPSMTVMFPPFPSAERVGVFVDVANLLYAARSMRLSIDFGRLLEFLRGNRRLVRAQAYAPTSPEPHAEQQFLSVVKGVGYRITTKNYRTFSSGARKADLDLDLCMDIVRLIEARALDTVVLVSGDSDFLPLLEYCSDHGVRVEVAAFDDATSTVLRQTCDLFINLSLVEDVRA